jgi:hypothetical protein
MNMSLRIAEAARYRRVNIASCADDVMHNCNCSYPLFYALQLVGPEVIGEEVQYSIDKARHDQKP